ncbi:MAG: hypothetical protein HQL32_08085 [Planctomycetes bacterium]|nr:hypothetical protein [Planctomycetota bacterium]
MPFSSLALFLFATFIALACGGSSGGQEGAENATNIDLDTSVEASIAVESHVDFSMTQLSKSGSQKSEVLTVKILFSDGSELPLSNSNSEAKNIYTGAIPGSQTPPYVLTAQSGSLYMENLYWPEDSSETQELSINLGETNWESSKITALAKSIAWENEENNEKHWLSTLADQPQLKSRWKDEILAVENGEQSINILYIDVTGRGQVVATAHSQEKMIFNTGNSTTVDNADNRQNITPITLTGSGPVNLKLIPAVDNDFISFHAYKGLSLSESGAYYEARFSSDTQKVYTNTIFINHIEIENFALDAKLEVVFGWENNSAPVITSTANTSISMGGNYLYQIESTDANNDTPVYTLSQGPTGMSVSDTGLVNWPAEVYGTHDITIAVSDLQDTTNHSYILNVINDAPVVSSTLSGNVLSSGNHQVIASDANDDEISYSILSAPSGVGIDSASGFLVWTGLAVDTHLVALQVSDGYNLVRHELSLNVTETLTTP